LKLPIGFPSIPAKLNLRT